MRNACHLGVDLAVVVLFMLPASAPAQGTSADTFDISRFSDAGHDWFDTFYPEETETLQQAIYSEKVTPEHRVLVTDTPDGDVACSPNRWRITTSPKAPHPMANIGWQRFEWSVIQGSV